MKKLVFGLLLLSNFLFGQINYEKGYFIDNNNNRIDCYIKNEDKSNNPTSFYYKNSLETNEKENFKSIENVKEFSIENYYKFERHQVQIDESSTDESKLSLKKNPEWVNKLVFLKVIVDGDAKLYLFIDQFVRKYFFSYKNSKVEQLVYKQYHSNAEGNILETILENNYYHQQLWNNIKCSETTTKRISKIKYNQKDLVEYFEEVNNCDGNKNLSKNTNFDNLKNKNGGLAIKIKTGINFNSFSIADYIDDYKIRKFDNQLTNRVSAEFEYVLPFKKNKISAYFEPSFQSKYDVTNTFKVVYNSNISYDYKWQVIYNSLDLTIGGKYKSFLSNSSNLFFNLGGTYNIIQNQNVIIDDKKSDIELKSNFSLTLGVGFEYKRISAEIRMNDRMITNKEILDGKFKNVSLLLGYKIFNANKKNNSK